MPYNYSVTIYSHQLLFINNLLQLLTNFHALVFFLGGGRGRQHQLFDMKLTCTMEENWMTCLCLPENTRTSGSPFLYARSILWVTSLEKEHQRP